MKRFVYICSPLRGDMERNIEKARQYCRYAVLLNPDVVPIAPHIYFTQCLNDNLPDERVLGMNDGLEMLRRCDELWVYEPEKLSEGMQREIEYAHQLGIPIRNGYKAQWNHSAESCVSCGDIIQEGRQVCPTCEAKGGRRI